MIEDINQEELGEEWNTESDEDMAAQWSGMLDEDEKPSTAKQNAAATKRILSQAEIDEITGFKLNEKQNQPKLTGIEGFIKSEAVTYEKLPMLEIILERLIRMMTSSLKDFTSSIVDVRIEYIRSKRLKDYLYSIPLPSVTAIYRVNEHNNFGLIVVTPHLVYSIIDVLLGGIDEPLPLRIQGKTYTSIEISIVKRIIELMLNDLQQAFKPVADMKFNMERIETDPRFADIDNPENIATEIGIHIDIADRSGMLEIVLPYVTLEPIRELLLQNFMGEKLGKDKIWRTHLSNQLWQAEVEVEAVINEKTLELGKLLELKIGDTIMLDVRVDDDVTIKCNAAPLIVGKVGKIGDNIAIKVKNPMQKSMKKAYLDMLEN